MSEKMQELQILLEEGRKELDYDFLELDSFNNLAQNNDCLIKEPTTRFEVIPTYELQLYNGE